MLKGILAGEKLLVNLANNHKFSKGWFVNFYLYMCASMVSSFNVTNVDPDNEILQTGYKDSFKWFSPMEH